MKKFLLLIFWLIFSFSLAFAQEVKHPFILAKELQFPNMLSVVTPNQIYKKLYYTPNIDLRLIDHTSSKPLPQKILSMDTGYPELTLYFDKKQIIFWDYAIQLDKPLIKTAKNTHNKTMSWPPVYIERIFKNMGKIHDGYLGETKDEVYYIYKYPQKNWEGRDYIYYFFKEKKAKDFRVLDNINGEYYNSFEMPTKEWNAKFYTWKQQDRFYNISDGEFWKPGISFHQGRIYLHHIANTISFPVDTKTLHYERDQNEEYLYDKNYFYQVIGDRFNHSYELRRIKR